MSDHAEQAIKSTSKRMSVGTIRTITKVHKFLRALTGNRLLNTLGGDEVCFVEMTGAKSGRTLNVPLMYVPHNDSVLLVASQGGNDRNPVWYHNLVQNPNVKIEHRGKVRELKARLATSEEKTSLWPVCDAAYAPFAEYRQFTDREIPIFVCEPV